MAMRGGSRESVLRADADRVDRFRLAIVEDCRRKGPIHSSARIDVAAVIAHVRLRFLWIKRDRRRMTVDNVFRERSPVTKEAVANPKLGFGGLLVEGRARTNPRMNIITEFVFVAGRERTHPFLRLLKRGRCTQGGDGCIATVGEEVCKVSFRFRRSKHELFVIAPKADSALGLKALDGLKDLAGVLGHDQCSRRERSTGIARPWRSPHTTYRFGRGDFRASRPSHECRRRQLSASESSRWSAYCGSRYPPVQHASAKMQSHRVSQNWQRRHTAPLAGY